MTMTDIEQVFVLEDLEKDRVCTPWAVECGRPAKWIMVTTCCWYEIPFCDTHKVMAEFIIARMNKATSYCRECGKPVEGYEVKWTPL